MKERKKLLIEPNFQRSLLLYFNSFMIALLGITTFAVYHFFDRLETRAAMDLNLLTPFQDILNQEKRSLFALILVSWGCAWLVGNAGTLIISHRIAGPIYRIRKLIQSVATGKSNEKLRLRKTDFFKDLVNEWNKAYTLNDK